MRYPEGSAGPHPKVTAPAWEREALLSALAHEDMALAHLINGQAELADYALGVYRETGCSPSDPAAMQMLSLRRSVVRTLQDAVAKQIVQSVKYEQVIGQAGGSAAGAAARNS